MSNSWSMTCFYVQEIVLGTSNHDPIALGHENLPMVEYEMADQENVIRCVRKIFLERQIGLD